MKSRLLIAILAVLVVAALAIAGEGQMKVLRYNVGVRPEVVNPIDQSRTITIKDEYINIHAPFGNAPEENEFEKNTTGKYLSSIHGGEQNVFTPSAANSGTSFNGPAQNGWIPYDAAVAVGPTYILVMSNEQFGIYTKSGSLVSLTQNGTFWGTTPSGGFDGKCFYDATAGHFVMSVDKEANPNAEMDVAVSQTSDPTGAWWIYRLNWTLDGSTKTSNWGDYPSLGYNDNAIFIGANQYAFSNSYKYSKVRVLSKAQLYSGATATWTDFIKLLNADGTSAFTVKAGRMLSSSASEYLLNTEPGGGTYCTLWRIDNAPTAPTLARVSTLSVGSYSAPPAARQPGGGSVASGDSRTQDVVMQNGNIYTAWTVAYGTTKKNEGDGIRYLQITTSGSIVHNIAYNVSGVDYYYPVVSVDASNNMLMVFSKSSTTEYASMYQTGMLTTDAGIETPALIKSGAGKITSGRWGDYSGISGDPSNPAAQWEYCGWAQSNGAWGSWVSSGSFGVAPKTVAHQIVSATEKPLEFKLNDNYPNPFNPSTYISFTLPGDLYTRLVVVDILGREVARLVDGDMTAGAHQVVFDASNMASGVYFYRLDAGANHSIKRMLLAK